MTKRQLGMLLIAGSLGLTVTLFAVDIMGASQFGGIGPVQRLALGGAAFVMLIGLSLLPLGDRPA